MPEVFLAVFSITVYVKILFPIDRKMNLVVTDEAVFFNRITDTDT